jgi:hypothetical protein
MELQASKSKEGKWKKAKGKRQKAKKVCLAKNNQVLCERERKLEILAILNTDVANAYCLLKSLYEINHTRFRHGCAKRRKKFIRLLR